MSGSGLPDMALLAVGISELSLMGGRLKLGDHGVRLDRFVSGRPPVGTEGNNEVKLAVREMGPTRD